MIDEVKSFVDGLGAYHSHLRQPVGTTVPPTYRIAQEEHLLLDADIPKEYRDATLSDSARKVLNEWKPTVALLGPPGTGKTRLCWAALRATRIRAAMKQAAEGSIPQRSMDFFDRETKRHIPQWITRPEWLPAEIKAIIRNDRVRIISEVSDLRRHRHDRDWLAETAAWRPHQLSLLCVDDIGFTGKADDWVMEALYELANYRRAHELPTLYTSNLNPEQMRDVFGAAITSRLLGGEVIALDGADRRLA